MVDENLFLYDLAVVAIMKNEEPYVQEWIDYHLLAGVDHFFIYDNDSTPDFKKILQPYIDAGIVTYTFYPGKCRQMESYNDAIQRYRFFCRYMAFIDADEFIFPKSTPEITEIVDETLKADSNIAGAYVYRINYGSNGEIKADYSRGLLERFTRRDKNVRKSVKSVVNPRAVSHFWTSHFPEYFPGFTFIFADSSNIIVNHYHTKSYEEYSKRNGRGNAVFDKNIYDDSAFQKENAISNEVFDDSILNYVDSRLDALTSIDDLINSKKINVDKLLKALNKNLSSKTFEGKVETFLTCLNLATFLKSLKLIDDAQSRTFEQAALQSLAESLKADVNFPAAHLLISELPKILSLSYSEVDEIRSQCLNKIENMMMTYRLNNLWQQFHELEFIGNLLTIKS